MAGEATPFYLVHPAVPAWVGDLMPDCKLIVLMRNPVDRAYSHWHHVRGQGYESLSFEGGIHQERQNVGRHFKHHSYLARGRYADQLKRWFRYFPREQFCFIRSETMREVPAATYDQVCHFLGVQRWHGLEFENRHVREYEPMGEAIRAELAEYFQPHNEALYELLGVDYGWA